MISLISGAKARKSSNQLSRDWFHRLLEPRPESHQIKVPGDGFLDIWSQGQKVTKSSLLGLALSNSGAKAEKSSNRTSWIRRAFYYRIIVYCVIYLGSSPSYSPSQRKTHEKYASTQRCFHNDLSAAAVTSHTLLLPA